MGRQGGSPISMSIRYDLSIVTVCRNALSTLRATVSSVLAQKQRAGISIEHLIIDGASTDGTPDYLQELLEQGKIERYVSEQDRGIYDAMNKGMRLARGTVLTFLNADDSYTEEDLSQCVLPIVRGATDCVAGDCASWKDGKRHACWPAEPDLAYLRIPLPHPALFIRTTLYRSLGGFDAEHFRCAADTDLMCALMKRGMTPLLLRKEITNFDSGGFSDSDHCETKFLDEHVEIMRRNWDALSARSVDEPAYAALVTVYLLNRSAELNGWAKRYGKDPVPTALALKSMCEEHCGTDAHAAGALNWTAECFLPEIIRRQAVGFLMRQKMDFLTMRYNLPPSSPYVNLGFHRTKKKWLKTRFASLFS